MCTKNPRTHSRHQRHKVYEAGYLVFQGLLTLAVNARTLFIHSECQKSCPQKLTGSDNISSWVLRECADQLSDVLLNISLSQAVVPVGCKMTTIISVPKKSFTSCINDYLLIELMLIAMWLAIKHIKCEIVMKTLLPISKHHYNAIAVHIILFNIE